MTKPTVLKPAFGVPVGGLRYFAPSPSPAVSPALNHGIFVGPEQTAKIELRGQRTPNELNAVAVPPGTRLRCRVSQELPEALYSGINLIRGTVCLTFVTPYEATDGTFTSLELASLAGWEKVNS